MIRISSIIVLFLFFFSTTAAPVLAAINYSHDANGNMTSNGTNCYEYNEANQLKKIKRCSDNQIVAEYVYDYTGKRLVKKEYENGVLKQTVLSPSDEYETKKLPDGTTKNTTYYKVNDEMVAKKNPDGSINYYHNDHLGSTSVITDQNGNVVEKTTYEPYGEVKSGGTKSKFGYTGQEKDLETGLNYYDARYYDSHIQRFIQPDSVIQDVYDPQSLNRYAYVRNNPIKNTDPTGHFWDTLLDVGFIAYDLKSITDDPTNSMNYIALAADVVGAAVPGLTGGGLAVRSIAHGVGATEDAIRLAASRMKTGTLIADKRGDSDRYFTSTDDIYSFNSFNTFKKEFGSAGVGNNWHHIVEQSKVSQFGPEAIHNTSNIVNIPAQVNFNINGYYSSKQKFADGMTVRQWLNDQSYAEQYNFGVDILNQELNKYYRR